MPDLSDNHDETTVPYELEANTDEITACLRVLEAAEAELSQTDQLTETAGDEPQPARRPRPTGGSYCLTGAELVRETESPLTPIGSINLVQVPADPEPATEAACLVDRPPRRRARLRELPIITDLESVALPAVEPVAKPVTPDEAFSADDLPEVEPASPPVPTDFSWLEEQLADPPFLAADAPLPEIKPQSWVNDVPPLQPPPAFKPGESWTLPPAQSTDPASWLVGLPSAEAAPAPVRTAQAVLAELEAKCGPTDVPFPRYESYVDDEGDEVIVLDESDIIEWRIEFRPLFMPPIPADAGC
jgi:hypothetical protein